MSVTTLSVVVDTDVFIWLVRGKMPAALRAPLVVEKRLVLSFATVAELWRGAYAKEYGDRSKRALDRKIEASVVVPPTRDLTERWARLTDDARRRGQPLGQGDHAHDAWVAATSLVLDLPLLTGNRRHFVGIEGLDLVDLPSLD